MNFSGLLGHIVSATSLILSSLIFPHPSSPVISHVPSATPVVAPSYVATEHYTYDGHTVTAAISIPKSGGEVSGTISGECKGDITGTYDGGDNGKIQGTAEATCHVFFLSIPVTATYLGTVHTADKKVDLSIDAKANGFEKSQEITLSLH